MPTRSIWSASWRRARRRWRARSRQRLGWRAEDIDELIEARERLTVADIFARHGEALLPRRSSARSCELLLPLRHVVVATGGGTFMDPENRAAHQHRRRSRSGSTCRSTGCIARVPADGRRPLAADRAADRTPLFMRQARATQQAHLRVDAGRGAGVDEVAERVLDRLEACLTCAISILSRHPRQPRSARRLLAARRRRGWDRGAGARRPGRLRRRPERASSSGSARSIPPRSSAATTTRRPAASTSAATSTRGAPARRSGRAISSRRSTASSCAALPAGPADVDDAHRDLPRLAVRRGRLHLRRADARARASQDVEPAALPVRPHAPAGHVPARRSTRSRAARRIRIGQRCCRCSDGVEISGERGIGRPAARRRPAGGATPSWTTTTPRADAVPGAATRSRSAQRRILAAGLPASLANRLALGR